MARPSKFTPARVQMIVTALAAGNTRTATAAATGIGVQTFADWLHRFRDFRDAVEKAEAQAEVDHVANIAAAASGGTWTASAWWLERRRHADWGKVDRVEIELRAAAERIAESYPAESRPDPEWLIRRAEQIAAAAAGRTAGGSHAAE